MENIEKIKVLNALKNYIGEEKEKRGTVVINSYGHNFTYSGLISVKEKELIDVKKVNGKDRGINCPISNYDNDIETLYVDELYSEDKKLLYKRK